MSRNPALYDPASDPLSVPRNSPQVEHILATVTNKDDQIDAICEARGWMKVDVELREILDAYLGGSVSMDETVELLAAPIEDAYTSADLGYALWDAESTARCMRPLCTTKEEELQFWGEVMAMCEPDPGQKPRRNLEGQLWRLYFGIMHASRKQDWSAGDGRMSALVKLVQALQMRPDPPPPENATPAFHNHCVCKTGALWSDLCMLGPSAAESYNDQPGGTMGFTEPEARAWENENAFFAHLTATGMIDFMSYGVGAMRMVLEGGIAGQNQLRMTEEFKAKWIDVKLGVVVVWLEIAGGEMYARVHRRSEPELVMANGMSMEWKGEPTAVRWGFWKKRLAKVSKSDARSEAAKVNATRALDRMQYIEALYAA